MKLWEEGQWAAERINREACAISEGGDSRAVCELFGHRMLLMKDLKHLQVDPGSGL